MQDLLTGDDAFNFAYLAVSSGAYPPELRSILSEVKSENTTAATGTHTLCCSAAAAGSPALVTASILAHDLKHVKDKAAPSLANSHAPLIAATTNNWLVKAANLAGHASRLTMGDFPMGSSIDSSGPSRGAADHPFNKYCSGDFTRVLNWLEAGGLKACPHCLQPKDAHQADKNNQLAMMIALNECQIQHAKVSSCFVCGERSSVDQADAHVLACIQHRRKTAMDSDGLITQQNFCVVEVATELAATVPPKAFICPFRFCLLGLDSEIDEASRKRMRQQLRAVTLQNRPVSTFLGGGTVCVLKARELGDHIAAHLWSGDGMNTVTAPVVMREGHTRFSATRIVCPLKDCEEHFQDSTEGQLALLVHLGSDEAGNHSLPVVFDHDGFPSHNFGSANLGARLPKKLGPVKTGAWGKNVAERAAAAPRELYRWRVHDDEE